MSLIKSKTKYLNTIYDNFCYIASLTSLNNICEFINIIKINTYLFFSTINLLSYNGGEKKKIVDLENIYEYNPEKKIKKKKVNSNEFINTYNDIKDDDDFMDYNDYCAIKLAYGYKNNNYCVNKKNNINKKKIYSDNNCDWGWFVVIDDCK